MIGESALPQPPVKISLVMAQKARAMLERAVDAFIQRDAVSARSIPAADDEVDRLYNQAYQELIGCIIADQSRVEQANYLLWVAHNLERAADRVTNICERVLFTVTGEVVELDVDNAGLESLS
jgi:phosphate transport system protein